MPKEVIEEVRKEITALKSRVEEIREELERTKSEGLKDVKAVKGHLSGVSENLKNLRSLAEKLEVRVRTIEDLMNVGASVGLWKASTCAYKSSDGTCTAWRLDQASAERIRRAFGDTSVRDVDGVLRAVVDKVPLLCAFCPLYRPGMAEKKE